MTRLGGTVAHSGRPSRASVVAAAALVVALCAGCVGPATTPDVYRAKAESTASEAVSSARTAVLSVRTQLAGDLSRAGLEVLLQESEEALESVTSTFGSLQPPDTPAADLLRRQLGELLADAGDDAQELRIAARRDDRPALAEHAAALAETADRLDELAEELEG